MLLVRGLNKTYEYGAHALTDVNFALEEGRVLSVFAEEGEGKTSLLHCLAGLTPYEGSILLDGCELSAIPPQQRAIRLIHHDGGLLPGRVSKSFTYPLRVHGCSRAEARAGGFSCLQRAALAYLWEERTRYLHPDEVLRLAFARVGLTPERLLLADDPFSLVAAGQREELFRTLAPAFTGRTTVFATDSFAEACAVGDRVLVLHFGVVQALDTPAQLYARPATRYLARICYPYANLLEQPGEGSVLFAAPALPGETVRPECTLFSAGHYYHLHAGNWYRADSRLPSFHPGDPIPVFHFDPSENLSSVEASPTLL